MFLRLSFMATAGLLAHCAHVARAGQEFEPVPAAERSLYRFDFKKCFYADEAARQKDFDELKRLTREVAALKSEVATKPDKLLKAVELKARMGAIADRLQAYGGLRLAVNTEDADAKREADQGEEVRNGVDADTAFLDSAVRSMTDAQLRQFLKSTPGLAAYEFLFRTWRRDQPHRAAPAAEELLSRLASHLDPFGQGFYNLMRGRSPDAVVTAGGRSLNVTNEGDYAEVLRLDDRGQREAGFRKRCATYKAQGDLFAYAMYQRARSANAAAAERKFGDAMEASLFDFHLTPAAVDAVLKGFRDHAPLTIRFQQAERAYQGKLLGLERVEPWDLEARPRSAPEPRFGIGDASLAVSAATKNFGPDYQAELAHLLDPRNGRLDIVAGPSREKGAFTWGSYGPSWVVYMEGYRGYAADVATLAHESTHGVNYPLLHKAGVPWYYGDGARYFTEGLAKANELLVLDYLFAAAKSEDERLYYLRQFGNKVASVKFTTVFWSAYATSFEVEVYRRVKSGAVKEPNDIHEVWAEFGRRWVHDFDRFPDLKYTWADAHPFFGTPRYYSNYMFASVLALAVYERLQADPTTALKLTGLMKAGFPDEPAALLRSHLGLDLADPATLERMFALVERKVDDFERRVRGK